MSNITLCKNVVIGYDINGQKCSLCKVAQCEYVNSPYEVWKGVFCPVNAAIGKQAKEYENGKLKVRLMV